eukprot:Amastigsp_a339452_903.p2 type:complete len:128 gc:universal Amastigsp_a339452_903:304-687(+)
MVLPRRFVERRVASVVDLVRVRPDREKELHGRHVAPLGGVVEACVAWRICCVHIEPALGEQCRNVVHMATFCEKEDLHRWRCCVDARIEPHKRAGMRVPLVLGRSFGRKILRFGRHGRRRRLRHAFK